TVSRQLSEQLVDPLWSFEPPVTKQLGIKSRHDNPPLAGLLPMCVQTLAHDLSEMGSMSADLRKSPLRHIQLLVSQVCTAIGDAPVASPTVPLLLVKLKMGGITRIPGIMFPSPSRSLKVTAENRHRRRGRGIFTVYPVRMVRGVPCIRWGTTLKL